MGEFIPLAIPNFEGNEKKYVDNALDEGWVSTGGAYIKKFEQRLAEFLNTDNVAACQSGTAALHLSLVEAGVNQDDIVLVPPITFIAAVNPIRYQFAEPIFIDCDESFCMDPVKLKSFCTDECSFNNSKLVHNGKHVKAIIVVHIFGNLADMVSIMRIAQEYNLQVIEDATEALGSKFVEGEYAGKYAGTIGDFGAFSFNGNKIITTGGGGAVTSNSSSKVDHMRYLSTQAKDDIHYYIHNEVGYNYRMTNIQAAMGVGQLEMLPKFILRKRKNYLKYKELFRNYEFGKMVEFREGTESNCWFYSLEINKELIAASLKQVITKLEKCNVQTRAIWGLINEQVPYKEFETYKVEKAKYFANRIINLPCSTQITEENIKYVVKQVKKVLGELADEKG